MFNLEQSISEWRWQMLSAGVKNPDILDELESHLREDWERRVQSGESGEQAFEGAVQGVGQASLLKHEFAKPGVKKRAWLRKLKGILAGAFDPVPALSTFTPGARWTLELARQEAPRLNHGFVGTEHVLLGLLALEDGVVPNVFKEMGVDRDGVRRQIENWMSNFSPPGKMPGRVPYTPRVRKSLYYAAREARVSRNAPVGAEHILLGLVLEGDGVAGRVLRDFGLNPETTRAEIMREAGRNQCGSMDGQLENRLRFLRNASTEGMPHSEVGLFDHLLGTRRLLVEWKARPALCDAGLFHSVYSTEAYELKAIPLSMRDEVRQLIGDEAESLVWLFCMMRRETLYQNLRKDRDFSVQHRLTGEWIPLTEGQFQDLVTLSFANCLEAFPRCPWNVRRNIRRGLRHFRGIAIGPAQSALDRIDAHWWEFWK
jgi:hypothetical protein